MEEKVKKQKGKVRKLIEWIGTAILGVIFVFAAVMNVSKLLTRNEYGYGTSFGLSTYVVLTDSMEPKYKVNTAIIAYQDKPEEVVKKWNEIKDLSLELTDDRAINMTFVDAYTTKVGTGMSEYTNQTTPTGVVMTHQLFKVIVNEDVSEGNGRYQFFVHGINISEHQSGVGQYQVFTEKEYLGVVKSNSTFLGGVSRFIGSVWGLLICLLIPCIYLMVTSVLDIFKAYKEDEGDDENNTPSDGGSTFDSLSDKQKEELKQQMLNEMLNGKAGK
ncbi:MAG: hypothetical protein MJZ37_04175 [Bacilli bacterium]|nr:hypothetical protein [Bacilli bacterium]